MAYLALHIHLKDECIDLYRFLETVLELGSYNITNAGITSANAINSLLKITNNSSTNSYDETEAFFEIAEADDSWSELE